LSIELIEKGISLIRELELSTNYFLIFINSLLITLFIFLKHKSCSIKYNLEINYIELSFKILVGCLIGGLLLLLCSKPQFLFFTVTLSPLLSEILYDKYFSRDNILNLEKQNQNIINVNINNDKDDEIKDQSVHNSKLENLDYIDKPDLDNIIDILTLYDYISLNHRRKLYESAIFFPEPEDAVCDLLEMDVLTKEELEEAYAIKNLIKLEGRLVTKEEALVWILKCQDKNKNKYNCSI